MVVWVIMLLSLLAAGLGSRQVFALGLVQRMEQELQASYIASAAVQQAMTLLQQDATPKADGLADSWANDQTPLASHAFGSGAYTIRLVDEERRLNLNTAPVGILQRLLEQVGRMREEDAQAVADAVVDWRDKDSDAGEDGAEDFYYLSLERAYECKDAPFENVEELALIRGMTPMVYRRVAPYLTVYGSGQVNLNTAPVDVLHALGFSDEGVNGVVFYRAGEDNVEGTADDRMIGAIAAIGPELSRSLPKEDLPVLMQLLQEGLVGVGSDAFRAQIEARVTDAKYPVHVEAVMTREGRIHLWMEQ